LWLAVSESGIKLFFFYEIGGTAGDVTVECGVWVISSKLWKIFNPQINLFFKKTTNQTYAPHLMSLCS
jgi:hypothetical protein